ncbi:hypothetical protein D6774_04760 [Candidatus Woesearchaeota archaeon]|nr:MAG: hypothetical protein D6774_04760 [Candidatus Woesearchaeota archaeon]
MKNWQSILYPSIIALLFIPLVFMGANVFFEEKTYEWKDCFYPKPSENMTAQERAEQQACADQNRAEQERIDKENNTIRGYKYVFVTLASLIALLVALFAPVLDYVKNGLFMGAVLSSFFSTWTYFGSRSKVGFLILVVIFILSIWFINKTNKKK